MPELPEVETLKTGLISRITNKKIKNIIIFNEKSFILHKSKLENVLGSAIRKVNRRGKLLIIELSNDYNLLVHLKMTGQLVFVGKNRFGAGHPNDSLVSKLPDTSTRVEFILMITQNCTSMTNVNLAG